MYKGYTATMKDVTNNTSSARAHDNNFWNKELWDIKRAIDTTHHTRCMLDDRYKKYDLHKFTSNKTTLTYDEHVALYDLLTKYELLFDGTLCMWETKPLFI